MDNEEMGELIHKVEMLEMDFLGKNGVNPNYVEVEKHIEKITDMFEKQFEQNSDEIEEVLSDLEDKRDVIESVSDNLSDLKILVQSMKKSIERMELDLC